MRKFHLVIALLAISTPLQAQNVTDTTSYAYLMSLPVPVVEGDILDKPYRVIGHIDKGVRKATVFSKPASHDKVMRELWEKGRKMGADAVINAGYGEAHKVAFSSWGTREARGTASRMAVTRLRPSLPSWSRCATGASSPMRSTSRQGRNCSTGNEPVAQVRSARQQFASRTSGSPRHQHE